MDFTDERVVINLEKTPFFSKLIKTVRLSFSENLRMS